MCKSIIHRDIAAFPRQEEAHTRSSCTRGRRIACDFCIEQSPSSKMVVTQTFGASSMIHLQVSFEIADIMTCDLRPHFYDVIYSRDTILHIEDKLTLFKRQAMP